jgi:hypothetical protein
MLEAKFLETGENPQMVRSLLGSSNKVTMDWDVVLQLEAYTFPCIIQMWNLSASISACATALAYGF